MNTATNFEEKSCMEHVSKMMQIKIRTRPRIRGSSRNHFTHVKEKQFHARNQSRSVRDLNFQRRRCLANVVDRNVEHTELFNNQAALIPRRSETFT